MKQSTKIMIILLWFLIMLMILSSCSSSQEEIDSCNGKTVKSIDKGVYSTIVTFTDETYIKFTSFGEPVYVKVHEAPKK